MTLKARIEGRRTKKTLLEENESRFLGGIVSSAVMDISQEELIKDVIENYQNFIFKSITGEE